MSIFGKIASAIFGAHMAPAPEGLVSGMPTGVVGTGTEPAAAAPSPSVMSTIAAVASAAAPAPSATVSMAGVDVGAVLDGMKAKQSEALDWRKSIVDLMKLLHLDSSLSSRKELATELHYTGDMGDSASMNVWLHKQVMIRLAENGGVVPAELKH